MKSREQKGQDLKKLKEKLPGAHMTVFTTFAREGEKGLSVAQLQELRRALREIEADYMVTKKSLVDRAVKDLKYDGIDVFGMNGSVGIVLGRGDGYALAKKLYDFAKKNQALKFFGAWYEGAFVDQEHVTVMAQMPSKEVLLGRLFGMLKYPVSSLAIVLSEVAKTKGQITAEKASVETAPSEESMPVSEPEVVSEAEITPTA